MQAEAAAPAEGHANPFVHSIGADHEAGGAREQQRTRLPPRRRDRRRRGRRLRLRPCREELRRWPDRLRVQAVRRRLGQKVEVFGESERVMPISISLPLPPSLLSLSLSLSFPPSPFLSWAI